MEQSRKILIEFAVDWEDYEDIADELIVEDMGILDGMRNGITYRIHKFTPAQITERKEANTSAGLPTLPQPIISDDDLKAWEESERNEHKGAVWVKGQYDRLYDQVKGGKRTVCYVDYPFGFGDTPTIIRDICTVKPERLEFTARGIGYGSVEFKEGDPKENFIQLCESLNVEWLDESGSTESDAVEFAEWIKEQKWESRPGVGWMKHSDDTPYVWTTRDLYEKFKS